jgi:hypothetical protein
LSHQHPKVPDIIARWSRYDEAARLLEKRIRIVAAYEDCGICSALSGFDYEFGICDCPGCFAVSVNAVRAARKHRCSFKDA